MTEPLFLCLQNSTLLQPEGPKLYGVLAPLSAVGLIVQILTRPDVCK